MIAYISPKTSKNLTYDGNVLANDFGEKFPIVHSIPRFVENGNYAKAFGFQWKTFVNTQLDSLTNTNESKIRLERCLGYTLDNLKGKNVLEVGAGAGRFTELLVKAGAFTHSVDLSNAVEANLENIGQQPNYQIAQANVYELPYPKESFDVVICLGVIQHTPSSEKTIKALWEMVKPSGELIIDHYKWRPGYYTTPGPYFRFFLKRMSPERSRKIVEKLCSFYFPIHWAVRKNAILTWIVRHLSPVLENMARFESQGFEYNLLLSQLETYDHLTDFYKYLITKRELISILNKLPKMQEHSLREDGNGYESKITKLI